MKLSISGSSLHNPRTASFLLSYSILAEEIKQHRHLPTLLALLQNQIMLVKIMTFNSFYRRPFWSVIYSSLAKDKSIPGSQIIGS
jgi:hypothetical protein